MTIRKQAYNVLSTTEEEFIAIKLFYFQILWSKQQLMSYSLKLDNTSVLILLKIQLKILELCT